MPLCPSWSKGKDLRSFGVSLRMGSSPIGGNKKQSL